MTEDNRYLITNHDDYNVYIWDLISKQKIWTLKDPEKIN